MTWNGSPLTLRTEGKDDRLYSGSGDTWGNDDGVYYQNLPEVVKEKMPLYGTQAVNTNDINTLYLPTKTMGYMFRINTWMKVDMNGWTEVSVGPYLSGYNAVVIMYKKEFEAGTYKIDNQSAMYLFDPDY